MSVAVLMRNGYHKEGSCESINIYQEISTIIYIYIFIF